MRRGSVLLGRAHRIRLLVRPELRLVGRHLFHLVLLGLRFLLFLHLTHLAFGHGSLPDCEAAKRRGVRVAKDW